MISDNKHISEVESTSLQQFENNENFKLKDVTPKLTQMWFRYPHLLKLNIYLLSAIFACITYGYDSSMMGNLQTLPSWSKYFNNPSGDILSTMNNGVSIGALGAIPFASFINDSFGRKTIIIVVTSFIDRDSLPISETGNDKLSIHQFPGRFLPSCIIYLGSIYIEHEIQ